MKKTFTKILVALCILPLFFFSGCYYFDFAQWGGIVDYDGSKITSFKACFKTENYEQDNTISVYARLIVEQLYANFGILNNENFPSLIENKPNPDSDENYDKIRVQANLSDINKDLSWLWTFSQTHNQVPSLNESIGAEAYYQDIYLQSAYYSEFVPRYSIAMEIVLYEIMTNQTPTQFIIVIDDNLNTTAIYADSAKTKEIYVNEEEDECSALSEAKSNFSKNATHVGLTVENLATLKDYILNKIIGEEIISSIYNKVVISGQGVRTLEYVVDQILNLEPEIESATTAKSIYSPYPASYIQDFSENKLYIDSESQTPLAHIPSREYQSLAVIPSSDVTAINGIWMAFESEYAMTIQVSINFYDSNSGLYSRLPLSLTLEIPAGTWSAENIICFDWREKREISNFVDPKISSSEPTAVNNSLGTSNFYNIFESGNNIIGVLNSNAINKSYYEIVFEIEKNTSRDYFPFKAGIFMVWSS